MLSDIQHDNSPAGQILRLLQHQRRRQRQGDRNRIRGHHDGRAPAADVAGPPPLSWTADTVREKRGRPHAVYSLSDKGHELFAGGSMDFANALLGEVLADRRPGDWRNNF